MKREEKISVIIPNYNGKKHLAHLLPQLTKILDKEDEIIIVDNGSTDGSSEFVKKNYGKVNLINLSQNKGFGFACNMGARKSRNDFLLFLNNDIYIEEDFISPLITFLKEKDVFSVYPLIYVPGRNESEGMKKRLFRFNVYKGAARKTEKYGKIGYSIYPPGCCFLTKKEYFFQLEGFDEIFSLCYWEDIDIGYRAWKRGLKTIYIPVVSVIHAEGSTTRTIHSSCLKIISIRNKLIFIWKNYSDPLFLFFHFITIFFKIFEATVKGQKEFLIGLRRAIKEIRKISEKRNKEKKFWRYSDRQILRMVDKEIEK